MSLYFLDDVFLLYLPLKAAQGIFEGFSLLQSDFCQLNYTPKLVLMGQIFIASFRTQVKGYCDRRPVRDAGYSIWTTEYRLSTSMAGPVELPRARMRRSRS
jgi:hypothetical protein